MSRNSADLRPKTASAIYPAGLLAPPPRTLLDILDETTRLHPEALALDDGAVRLDYRSLRAEVDRVAAELAEAGIGRGARVGVRIASGTAGLYVSILAVLATGAAYVPVDADDPDERAELVFAEAGVDAVIAGKLTVDGGAPLGSGRGVTPPLPDDDAWIIFTSGSTGKPKGVAVTHRSAAAFADAEAGLFLRERPLGPGDRVLAGLSVAFDASCEEMWLAWRHGACLVPAPRALVRTGMDLGPWLEAQRITAVSTVPTLAALWPVEHLGGIRLLIFGGEACPPELAERLAVPGREVWNTYGPTEATVVASAARLTGDGPVRIGLPLDGWDLAVVGDSGEPVAMGESGELVIGGVGLARYLDPVKDAEKYAPLPSLGWERAYRSGDLVRADPEGLVFIGRADDQVKLGGRRIELGEVDAALQALPGVTGAASAVRTAGGGHQVLVGYVVTGPGFDTGEARELLADSLPAALVPRLAPVGSLPTRTSGKIDRDALPWPLAEPTTAEAEWSPAEALLAERWAGILGVAPEGPGADFFADGGTSLAAARLVSVLRPDYPDVAVGDVYARPTLAGLARLLVASSEQEPARPPVVPMPRRAALVQSLLMVPLLTVGAMRWIVLLAALNNLLAPAWAPALSWWWVALGGLAFVTPMGRMGLSAALARLLLRGVRPGSHPRGGDVHLRLWFAEQFAARLGVPDLASAPWMAWYARLLGAKVGPDADLHSPPPVTGLLRLGRGASVEQEVDLTGHWYDGDLLHIGEIRIGAGATVGSRSTLLPGARIGKNSRVAPGSAVTGTVPSGELWAGAPAFRQGKARKPGERAGRSRFWASLYGLTAIVLSLLPAVATGAGLAVLAAFAGDARTLGAALTAALAGVPLATITGMAAFALITLVSVRLLGLRLRPGQHPVHSRQAWQAWATGRLMASARVWLFPLYASVLTPAWLRALGMKVGRGVELSTVLALPTMTSVGDGAFLADDTMVAPYELDGGWMRIASARIGKRAFLGNSGMTAPGRKVPKDGLVGVLSAAPKKAKSGSSYVGMPPMELRRTAEEADRSRTYDPPARFKAARALVEGFRVVPAMCAVALAVLVAAAFEGLAARYGFAAAAALSGVVMLVAGVVAAAVATAAKWALVGRIPAGNQPLWSSFVWLNELADNFVEVLAAPWFAQPWLGTAPLNVWLRSLGARIGHGVTCDTYWLPEADLVTLGDGACVNRGCVLQTHLFHDRVMSMDTVTLEAGATLGPHGVVLPAARVGADTTIGPASLVMRGETVPSRARWFGNPIAAWR
ncbi:amino acid adenylation domain-containing protein [Nonomuraea turkmeniaca]|uniref:Amino acid adenylation domain-containing protein n=1 Tax=Nonomuraea turkmeniaca TaxID=103838 RepID=A0A5S4G4Z4_9ACTN|nr:Pls/PosA family non-ribosomal peptide synthetase [Nonomuraea turkmeniaca]TMR21030.1 amino acid adenylation domain-containing protein [Nonomuraea turkmeniaca]